VAGVGSFFRRARIGIANTLRRRRHVPRYVLLTLSGEIDELPSERPSFPLLWRFMPPEPWSVTSLRRALEQLALDPRVEGVVLRIECFASGATYQSLRKLLLDFRAQGKRLIAYAHGFGPFQYYLACACDKIIMPPSAEWGVLGLLREYVFFKDLLDQLGIGVDVINVSPFKSAFDQFARNDFSEESRAQAEWLLNAQFDELVRGVAEGRSLSEARVRALIDAAPLGAQQAVEQGLLDAALYEDELEHYLVPPVPVLTPAETALVNGKPERKGKRASASRQLGLYEDVHGTLLIPFIQYAPKVVGVVKVEGTIVEGKSRSLPLPIPLPLFGNRLAGADSVVQALRRAADDDRIAAIILYVDSGGGGVLASDLIAREVRRVLQKKPLVAYMSGIAASGGYYISALARQIVAQPLTITGSIGVITLKPNAQRAEDKLLLHRTILKRGDRAAIYSPSTPLRPDEYAAVAGIVQRAYDDFKRIVAEGRKLNIEELEPISGGRVWTGAMAHARGLVDDLGDFTLAVQKARELSGLSGEKRVGAVIVTPPRKFVLPTPAAAGAALQALRRQLLRTRVWAVLPWLVDRSD
jgi:protease-4